MSTANSLSVINETMMDQLVEQLDHFVDVLGLDKDLQVHQKIDQFFYMEKLAEIRVLVDSVKELRKRISGLEGQKVVCYYLMTEKLLLDRTWLDEYNSTRSKDH